MNLNNLKRFIEVERYRFAIIHNNLFAKTFEEISRYYLFLIIIKDRHSKLVQEYTGIFNSFQKSIDKSPGPHTFTDKQMKLDKELIKSGDLIQLEVESFYQFAKILLDKIAFAIEFYFGRNEGSGLQIESHHWMVEDKNNSGVLKIEHYCQSRNIQINDSLINIMKELQSDISKFRDKSITHMSSPRIIRGTSLDGKMILGKIYPHDERDSISKTSKSLDELLMSIESYIDLIIRFIQINKEKTVLTTEIST